MSYGQNEKNTNMESQFHVFDFDNDGLAENEYFNITLSKSIETINEGAFIGCKIKNITIPSNVKYIKNNVLQDSALESITFNEGLKEVGSRIFLESTKYNGGLKITEITLPSSIEKIGDGLYPSIALMSLASFIIFIFSILVF